MLFRSKGLHLNIEGQDRFVIHSTTEYWRIGKSISMGCVRMSIPDMLELFPRIDPGTHVRIVYDTVEVAAGRVRIYQDIYRREGDRTAKVISKLVQAGYSRLSLDRAKIRNLTEGTNGRTVPVSALLKKNFFQRLEAAELERKSGSTSAPGSGRGDDDV